MVSNKEQYYKEQCSKDSQPSIGMSRCVLWFQCPGARASQGSPPPASLVSHPVLMCAKQKRLHEDVTHAYRHGSESQSYF